MGWVGFGSAAGKKEWVGYYRLVTLTARWNDFTYDSCTSGVGRGEVLVDPNGVDGAAERWRELDKRVWVAGRAAATQVNRI